MIYTPYISEKNGFAGDLFSRMLKDRIVFLFGEIDDNIAGMVVSQMMYLDSADNTKDIQLYINSPGGSVTAGMAIYDTMRCIKADVATVALGEAASMGAFLLAAGARGKRYALKNSEIMIHQPAAGAHGQATDIQIRADNIKKCKERMERLLSDFTGKSRAVIKKVTDRDYFMTAEEAVRFGIVDFVK